jgi:tetratricopeptide (TPR) repeat protein
MRHRFLMIALVLLAARTSSAAAETGILVMPFENVKRDARIFWLGEASSVLLTDDLTALGGTVVTRQERQQAFKRLQVPPAAALTDATLIRIGQVVGAAEIVVGTLQAEEGLLVVHARSIALDTGRIRVDVTERGTLPELFAIFERIARRIMPDSTKTAEEARPGHPSIAVFENFIKGLLAETPETASKYLWTALRLEPTFERARLALWDVYSTQGDYGHALDAVDAIPPDSPNARRARFLAGLAYLDLARNEEAYKTLKALADEHPTAAVLNNLGVLQLRRGGATPQTGLPMYYFSKAVEADPDDPDYLFNLAYAYWMYRDHPAATYWLREAVRRNRADADAHFVLGTALAAAGNATEAARERDLARRLSADYESLDRKKFANAFDGVPRRLERIKQDLDPPRSRRIDTRLAASEQRDQEEVARFHLDRGRRLFQQENDRAAVDELDRALYLSPYLAEAHLLLGRIHLRSGRIQDAISALKISLWSAETADVHVALGEAYRQDKDPTAARAEAERALALNPASEDARQLLARLEGR